MGLSALVRGAVATANKITADLQPEVTLERWIGQNATGPLYGEEEFLPAVVEYGVDQIVNDAREIVPVQAKVTFIRPIEPEGSRGRKEPLDTRDRVKLPNGTSGPLVRVRGMVDGETGEPYMIEAWVGH